MAEFNLEPSQQLLFQESSDKLFQQVFKIHNPTNDSIAFKIKTTSPKHYCVRPNVGLIAGHGEQEIEVLLQPRKDKFLIMAAKGGNETTSEDVNRPEYWNNLETNQKDMIAEKRLKCVFTTDSTAAAGGQESGAGGSGVGSGDEKALHQANERIKKLEVLLAETKRAKLASSGATSGGLTSGIVPMELASSFGMLSHPQSMFPPVLVLLVAVVSFFLGLLC